MINLRKVVEPLVFCKERWEIRGDYGVIERWLDDVV